MTLFSCSTVHQLSLDKKITATIEESPIFKKNFTGLMLFDPEDQKVLYSYNADKYFNPASNTKLFTFYAGLNILGDSIPGLAYTVRGDSLIFKGTADPSFLNPDLGEDLKIYNFLKKTAGTLFYSPQNYPLRRYGPGWAWDDYNSYYATEKSAFPIYGNVVRFYFEEKPSVPKAIPAFFADKLVLNVDTNNFNMQVVQRKELENTFLYFFPIDPFPEPVVVPFRYYPDLFVSLLEDTLSRTIHILPPSANIDFPKKLYSLPVDSLYKRMLQVSDNFIAEHILLLCAGAIADTLDSRIAIKYMKKNYLNDFPDELRWVDGSGLSRYNLFTPRSLVKLLEKIWNKVPREKLFTLFPVGGKSGNLQDYFQAQKPYVYAKTGTLSNNYCLSGYLVTKKGKTLIFSFMNNNYTISEALIKHEMEKVLRNIHERY